MPQASLSDDLAYVRELAEAGQQAPLLGGRFLAWWGGMATLAYAAHYFIVSGLAGLDISALMWTWGAFIVIAPIGYVYLVRSMGGAKPGASSLGNRVEAIVWKAAGFAMSAFFATLIVKSFAEGGADPGFGSSLPLVFSAYGIGLITSGSLSQTRLLVRAGYGAMVIVALSAWFSNMTEIWAVAAIGVFLTVFLPGMLMLRQEPKSIV